MLSCSPSNAAKMRETSRPPHAEAAAAPPPAIGSDGVDLKHNLRQIDTSCNNIPLYRPALRRGSVTTSLHSYARAEASIRSRTRCFLNVGSPRCAAALQARERARRSVQFCCSLPDAAGLGPPPHHGAVRCGWMRAGLRRSRYHIACHSGWQRHGTA